MRNFFERYHGPPQTESFKRARANFISSLAAYCILCYILQIKDRHNGNILLDTKGHVIHIDFGFMLSRSPGGNFNVESAPFKLTDEYIALMEGPRSIHFKKFRELCIKTFMELRKHRHKIILLVEMMATGNENLPCFVGKPHEAVEELRKRFKPDMNDSSCRAYVNGLIDSSMRNWGTQIYDRYQRCFVGIA